MGGIQLRNPNSNKFLSKIPKRNTVLVIHFTATNRNSTNDVESISLPALRLVRPSGLQQEIQTMVSARHHRRFIESVDANSTELQSSENIYVSTRECSRPKPLVAEATINKKGWVGGKSKRNQKSTQGGAQLINVC